MRGASFTGAYSLATVKVVLSDPKYLSCQNGREMAEHPRVSRIPRQEDYMDTSQARQMFQNIHGALSLASVGVVTHAC